MSDGDAPEEADTGADEAPDEGGDVPPIEDDERADLPDEVAALADEVEADVGLSDAGDDAGDGEGDGEGDEQAAEAPAQGEDAPDTWGDAYIGTVAMLALAAAEELGDGDPDRDQEDIAALLRAEPLCVDDAVNQLLADMGTGADLPPGQAVLLGTGAVIAVVLITEADLAGDLVDQLTNQFTTTTDNA
jgi:hypothetical protein